MKELENFEISEFYDKTPIKALADSRYHPGCCDYIKVYDKEGGEGWFVVMCISGKTTIYFTDNQEDIESDSLAEWTILYVLDFGMKNLERCAWEVAKLEDFAVKPDFEGAVVIVRRQNFFGPSYPLSLVEGEDNKVLVFKNYQEAQSWLDKANSEIYETTFSESGRPAYSIWDAQDFGGAI